MNYLIATITTAMNEVAEQMKKRAPYGFGEVKTLLDSLVDAILKKEPEEATVQDLSSISTGMQIQNVQIPPHVIETNKRDLNYLLHQLKYLSININAMSTQILVHMRRVSN